MCCGQNILTVGNYVSAEGGQILSEYWLWCLAILTRTMYMKRTLRQQGPRGLKCYGRPPKIQKFPEHQDTRRTLWYWVYRTLRGALAHWATSSWVGAVTPGCLWKGFGSLYTAACLVFWELDIAALRIKVQGVAGEGFFLKIFVPRISRKAEKKITPSGVHEIICQISPFFLNLSNEWEKWRLQNKSFMWSSDDCKEGWRI